MPSDVLLRMEGISKAFPGVRALDNVSIEIKRGEVHGICGENGAGKSTLMNILGGVLQPDGGSIYIEEQRVNVANPRIAEGLGISFIHQELALFPTMDVASNLFIGTPPAKIGLIKRKELYKKSKELLERVGLEVAPSRRLDTLKMGERQLVEIAKALRRETRVLVLDEPTSSLTERETEILFNLIRELATKGVAILYVSHRLDEIFSVCDRVTVLRDGKKVGTVKVAEINKGELIRMIIGRELSEIFPKNNNPTEEVLLEVSNLTRKGVFKNVSFVIRKGEIVGLTGLMGSGRTEVARAIFGLDPLDSGTIKIRGQRVTIESPEEAIKNGIGFVTEDRRGEGLMLEKSVRENVVLANLGGYVGPLRWWVNRRKQEEAAQRQIRHLRIATPDTKREVRYLSGGNQQKVVVGKWLEAKPQIFLLDEPTRGVDVGAKAEIHQIMNQLAQEGAGILLISSELPEVIGMSDRILVMRDGNIVAELSRQEATQERILSIATGSVA